MDRLKALFVMLALPLLVSGCHRADAPNGPASGWQPPHTLQMAGAPPSLGEPRAYDATVSNRQVEIPLTEGVEQVWIYLPTAQPGGKIPCVFIAPAGSRLFHGMGLGDGDRAEHIPYVHAGFAVVAYSMSGPLFGDNPTETEVLKAAGEFKNAEAGVANARIALDYVLKRVPQIDPERIYAAGHSSAATEALLVAAHESRIKACVAHAPCCDVPARLGGVPSLIRSRYPDFNAFIQWSSPDRNASIIRCPVFLFHADDDDNIGTEEVSRFAEQLQATNSRVTFMRTPSGGHYNSMVTEGIPRAIDWLKKLVVNVPSN